jgi:pimeloyl-ACP methyl ester carboxylesterase
VKAVVWVAAACGAVIVLSLWIFWMAVRPPRLTISGTPRDYGLAAEALTITTGDGVRLAAWLIPARTPDAPALVLLHGYPANKADLLPIASALNARFTVLLVDFRSFGSSGGRVTTLGSRERADLRAAVDTLAGRGHTRIGVFGYSLGARSPSWARQRTRASGPSPRGRRSRICVSSRASSTRSSGS